MAARRLMAGLALAAGSIAGALYLRRQRLAPLSERACLYFADGTLLEINPERRDAEELLAPARELLEGIRQKPSWTKRL